MKQHFFMIAVSAFIALVVVSVASMFIDIPSFTTIIEHMTTDPNASKENLILTSTP